MSVHEVKRVRHALVRRTLTVTRVEALTPRMTRVHFASPSLVGFVSASPDDHIKLFFPVAGEDDAMRDFTPRAFDAEAGTLVIDFALHEDGVATRWAASARVGQSLDIGGPRSSLVVRDDFDWYLLVGDEAGLPAIARRVEELRADVPVFTVVAVQDEGEGQMLAARAAWRARWVERATAGDDDARTLCEAIRAIALPPGDGFVFIAAESAVARAVRAYVVETCAHPKAYVKAAAYWKRGEAGAHDDLADDR